MKKIKQTQL